MKLNYDDSIREGLERAKAFYCNNEEVRMALEWAIEQRNGIVNKAEKNVFDIKIVYEVFKNNFNLEQRAAFTAECILRFCTWRDSTKKHEFWSDVYYELERIKTSGKL